MRFKVLSRFYNDGKVTAEVKEVSDSEGPEASWAQTAEYDEYHDIFDTREEADEFARQTIEET